MAVGREFYQLIRLYGGLAIEYQSLIESDFTAVAGAAYAPPEEGAFRRIAGARNIQFQAQIPGIVETFQTSAATIFLPANTVAEATNDAANGRLIVIKNSGTGNIVIKDYLSTTLFTLKSGLTIIALSNNNNAWDFIFTGKNTFFDNTVVPAAAFISNSVEDAIYELFSKSAVSASPGFTWGRSGNVTSGTWLQNDTVPSNLTGRNFPLYNGDLMQISVANEDPNTFNVDIYEHDGVTYTLLATCSLTAQRSKVQVYSGVAITRGKELAVQISSGSCKNPVVAAILKGTSTP